MGVDRGSDTPRSVAGAPGGDEARQLEEFDAAVLAIVSVDDFDPSELRRVAQPATLPFHDTAGAVG